MSAIARNAVLKPPLSTDSPWYMVRRAQFDFGNESLLLAGVRPDVLFIGDSITHVWELQAYFGAGKILVNRGIGGDTTTLLRERFAADALQLRPRRIVMKIGTNDLGWEMPQLSREVIAAVVENIAAMAADAQAAGIPLALCSLLPIWGPSWLDDPPSPRRKTRRSSKSTPASAK
ncbi:MAG: GDSL-type esterase/lipase family protein [Armatimonadota bacterium]